MKEIQLQVTDELAVTVIPNPLYEFMMPTVMTIKNLNIHKVTRGSVPHLLSLMSALLFVFRHFKNSS